MTAFGAHFLSHGGGPSFFVKSFNSMGIGPDSDYTEKMATMFKGQTPKLLVIVTAHWDCREKNTVYVSSNPKPGMYFDYYGFPRETYSYSYPAPGDVPAAMKAKERIEAAGIKVQLDDQRGFDHGVFIPMMLVYPKADIPVLTVSINSSYDEAFHLKLGAALAPFLDEEAMIIGSGFSTHSRLRREQDATWHEWLVETCTGDITDAERRKRLEASHTAPCFRNAHSRADHYVPLLVAAGAANCSRGKVAVDAEISVWCEGGRAVCLSWS